MIHRAEYIVAKHSAGSETTSPNAFMNGLPPKVPDGSLLSTSDPDRGGSRSLRRVGETRACLALIASLGFGKPDRDGPIEISPSRCLNEQRGTCTLTSARPATMPGAPALPLGKSRLWRIGRSELEIRVPARIITEQRHGFQVGIVLALKLTGLELELPSAKAGD